MLLGVQIERSTIFSWAPIGQDSDIGSMSQSSYFGGILLRSFCTLVLYTRFDHETARGSHQLTYKVRLNKSLDRLQWVIF